MGNHRGGVTVERCNVILERQENPRFLSDYIPSTYATREEAPSISRPAIIQSKKLGREMHVLGQPELHALLGVDEAPAQLQKALKSVERYREMSWLPAGLLKMAAISHIELFEVFELNEKLDRDQVGIVFEQMLEDAKLTEDADRLAYGEPVEMLQWLVMLYDRWLGGVTGYEAMWDNLVKVYADARFDRIVGQIRRHQASYT